MEINLDLYKIIHLPNGNILLKLKKNIDYTAYNLVLTDISFYKACEKNIGKINIYEPTNLTPILLKIIMDETSIIKSWDKLQEKLEWIHDNLSTSDQSETIKSSLKQKIDYYAKKSKSKLKISTLAYLFAKIIAELSGHFCEFGEEFFLLKLLNQYFPDDKWDYKEIYTFETYDDIYMCAENGSTYYNIVQRLCKGDKSVFDGKEIEFFPSSFEKNKMNISQEIFSCIEDDLDNDGINWKDYDPLNS